MEKNNFLLFAECLKMYSFFPFAFKICKNCQYDPNNFFHEKYQYRYQKNAEFYADFSLMRALKNAPKKSEKQKTTKKCTKEKILKIRIVFLAVAFLQTLNANAKKTVHFQTFAKNKKLFVK